MKKINNSFSLEIKLPNSDFYFIAEIGHNHQGKLDKLEMFLVAKRAEPML